MWIKRRRQWRRHPSNAFAEEWQKNITKVHKAQETIQHALSVENRKCHILTDKSEWIFLLDAKRSTGRLAIWLKRKQMRIESRLTLYLLRFHCITSRWCLICPAIRVFRIHCMCLYRRWRTQRRQEKWNGARARLKTINSINQFNSAKTVNPISFASNEIRDKKTEKKSSRNYVVAAGEYFCKINSAVCKVLSAVGCGLLPLLENTQYISQYHCRYTYSGRVESTSTF